MKLPTSFEEIREHFGDFIDEVTAKLLERYAKGEVVRGGETAKGRVVVEGRVLRVFPAKQFSRNGRDGKVASAIVGDKRTRVVFWNEAAEMVETGKLLEGAEVRVTGYMKNGEVHVNSSAEVEFINFTEISMLEGFVGKRVNVRGFVCGIGEPEKANEIQIVDSSGRVKVFVDRKIYYSVDIGSPVKIFNALVLSGSEIQADRKSRFKIEE